jgi:hypothetical protein
MSFARYIDVNFVDSGDASRGEYRKYKEPSDIYPGVN